MKGQSHAFSKDEDNFGRWDSKMTLNWILSSYVLEDVGESCIRCPTIALPPHELVQVGGDFV